MPQLKYVPLLFYGFVSFFITVGNKVILTSYGFPSYAALALFQMVSAVIVLGFLHVVGQIELAPLSIPTMKKIWPLAVLNLINVLFGLGGTKGASLPMFVVLRHLSIIITLILEIIILKSKPSVKVCLSVSLIVFGSLVAGASDLGFDLIAYCLITINNLATACNNVLLKLKLSNQDIDKTSLAFYNFLFAIAPLALICYFGGGASQVIRFPGWKIPSFTLYFLLSCPSAYLIFFSSAWCIEANSALTLSIVGVVKNTLVTTVGMFVGGDYHFNWPNFFGLVTATFGVGIYVEASSSKFRDQKTASMVVLPALDSRDQPASESPLKIKELVIHENGKH